MLKTLRDIKAFEIECVNCGTINDYSTEPSGPHIKATCNSCKKFIKFLDQDKPLIIGFGKYKGRFLTTLKSKEETDYIKWLLKEGKGLRSNLRTKLTKHLLSLGIKVEEGKV